MEAIKLPSGTGSVWRSFIFLTQFDPCVSLQLPNSFRVATRSKISHQLSTVSCGDTRTDNKSNISTGSLTQRDQMNGWACHRRLISSTSRPLAGFSWRCEIQTISKGKVKGARFADSDESPPDAALIEASPGSATPLMPSMLACWLSLWWDPPTGTALRAGRCSTVVPALHHNHVYKVQKLAEWVVLKSLDGRFHYSHNKTTQSLPTQKVAKWEPPREYARILVVSR